MSGGGNTTTTANQQILVSGVASAGTATWAKVNNLPPQPPQQFPQLDYHHAWMLAMLPREQGDDRSSAPRDCTITAAVPAILSLIGAFHADDTAGLGWSFSMGAEGLLYCAIFVGCAAWWLIRRRDEQYEITAFEYLEKLRTGTPITAQDVAKRRPKKIFGLI